MHFLLAGPTPRLKRMGCCWYLRYSPPSYRHVPIKPSRLRLLLETSSRLTEGTCVVFLISASFEFEMFFPSENISWRKLGRSSTCCFRDELLHEPNQIKSWLSLSSIDWRLLLIKFPIPSLVVGDAGISFSLIFKYTVICSTHSSSANSTLKYL